MHLYFLGCVQKFYIEGACQIKKRFPLDAPEIEMLEALDPSSDSQSKFPSLVPLCSRFPNLVDQLKLQIIDNEWRRLKIVSLPFDQEGMDPEEFWGRLSKIEDGGGSPQFGMLCYFMQSLLSLPHANVDVERIFSSVNLIKTKTRNRLHTSTVRSLLKVKDGVKSAGSCTTFKPDSATKMRMQSDTLYHCAASDCESDFYYG